jgi:predicted secreted protein
MDRLQATLAMVAMSSLLLTGCSVLTMLGVPVEPSSSSAPTGTTVVVSCDEFAAAPAAGTAEHAIRMQVAALVGQPIEVTLCSNGTTGFTWEDPVVAGGAGLKVTDHTTAAPGSSLVGAAGTETWTLVAGTPGSGTATFAYSRPWEGGEKGVWTFELDVTAR